MKLLSTEQKQGAILWTTAAFCPGIMSFGLPKLAVISLLTRLMNPGRYHKWFLWWMGIWCQLTLFVTAGLLLGRCTPARSLWDFSVTGKCFSKQILVAYCIYAGGMTTLFATQLSAPLTQFSPTAFSAFVDVYLAVYPAIVLFGLQMSTKKKVALSCALGIGSVYVLSISHASLLVTTVTNGRLIVLVLLLFTKQLVSRLSQAMTSLVGPLPALFRQSMGTRKADFLLLHR